MGLENVGKHLFPGDNRHHVVRSGQELYEILYSGWSYHLDFQESESLGSLALPDFGLVNQAYLEL